jgi:hypothetical protein
MITGKAVKSAAKIRRPRFIDLTLGASAWPMASGVALVEEK